MSHSHFQIPEGQHRSPSRKETRVNRQRANWLLAAILVPVGLAAVVSMIILWPSGGHSDAKAANPYSAASGASIDTGKVVSVGQECPAGGQQESNCYSARTQPDAGGEPITVVLPPELGKDNAVKPGNDIRYVNLSKLQDAGTGAQYVFMDFVRTVPIVFLALLYAGVVVLVARWRGLRALLGLGAGYLVMAFFILPDLVEGKPPLLVTLVGAIVIMYAVIYFAHGISARTSTALIGTLFGLFIMVGLASWATEATHVIGQGDENVYRLHNLAGQLSISGMITCGLIIAGLGVLNDVTITQASAVWELYELSPDISGWELFRSAMRIGRDHIASTVYTIAFAYAGGALPLLILVMLYDLPFFEALTSAELAEEVVRILVGSISLVLAIPVTTAIAALVVKSSGKRPDSKHSGQHRQEALPATEEALEAKTSQLAGNSGRMET